MKNVNPIWYTVIAVVVLGTVAGVFLLMRSKVKTSGKLQVKTLEIGTDRQMHLEFDRNIRSWENLHGELVMAASEQDTLVLAYVAKLPVLDNTAFLNLPMDSFALYHKDALIKEAIIVNDSLHYNLIQACMEKTRKLSCYIRIWDLNFPSFNARKDAFEQKILLEEVL